MGRRSPHRANQMPPIRPPGRRIFLFEARLGLSISKRKYVSRRPCPEAATCSE
jgi:hypothetical protein